MATKPVYMYGLSNAGGHYTYTGVTAHLKKRLRQHNGELAKGARTTRLVRKKTGAAWQHAFVLAGLPSRRVALQFEWRMHRRAGRRKDELPLMARVRQLCRAMHMVQVTTEAPLTSTLAPTIHWIDPALHIFAMGLTWPPHVRHVQGPVT
jgi:predicted GIY-YIG superfamily endonuclease